MKINDATKEITVGVVYELLEDPFKCAKLDFIFI